MRAPTEFEIQQLLHVAVGYDPTKAHDYYEKHKHLKGRRRGRSIVPRGRTPAREVPRTVGELKPVHGLSNVRNWRLVSGLYRQS
jgi:hypothetical protein